MEKRIKWYKVADGKDEIEWQSNHLALTEVGGRTITLAKTNNGIMACAHKCPHASGVLADGFVDALDNIVCPLHRYKFSMQNGRNISGEGYYLKTYPIEERDAGIFVGFDEANWLDIFK